MKLLLRRTLATVVVLLLTTLSANLFAQTTYYVCQGRTFHAYTLEAGTHFRVSPTDESIALGDTLFFMADIDSITFEEPQFPPLPEPPAPEEEEEEGSDTLCVTYSDTGASVYIPTLRRTAVSATVNGGHVVLDNTDTNDELVIRLTGTSSDGSLVYNAAYKTTFILDGLNLANPSGAALDIECSKRIALELPKGTDNVLSDGSGEQKAALYCKGHLEIDKGGSLTVSGNARHAIATKEYMQLKNGVGSITVLHAENDGIHAGQYYQQNGGNVTISGVKGDAIQAEATSTAEDELNGQLIVRGGSVTASVTAADCAALKADSLITINSEKSASTLTLTTSGAAAKGFKTKGSILVGDGTIGVTQSGTYRVASGEISYATALKAAKDITVSGGSITIDNSADGGKGLSADGNINISGAATVLNITANGKGASADLTSTDEEEKEQESKSYKVYVSLPTSSGGMGGTRPGGSTSNAWTTVSLYKSDGTLVQALTSSVRLSSGMNTATFYYYDFKEPVSGSYYFQSANYTSSGRTYTIRSATFTAPTNGSDIYYSISSSYTTSGTTRTYSLSNVTSTYAGGSTAADASGKAYAAQCIKADGTVSIADGRLTLTSKGEMSKGINGSKGVSISGGTFTITNQGNGYTIGNEQYTAKGITSDGNITLLGGDFTIRMSGSGGKGIKADGTLTIGNASTGEGPTLDVATTGSSYGSSTGGNIGGMRPGMGGSTGSSAKAIKAVGAVNVYGGQMTVSTASDGAEGLESKTSVNIAGGQHYLECYDDCINSSGNIYFNGGLTVCYATNNDAVDSNAGRTGAITIGNGVVVAYTSAGSPEEGLDCDNNSYIQITGTGTAISAGGTQGGGSSSSTISNAAQGYNFVTSSLSYSAGRYYTLSDASGKNLITYSFPRAISSTLALFTAKGMTKNSTYTVKYSTTEPTDATTAFHGVYLGSSATGTTQFTSFTAK